MKFKWLIIILLAGLAGCTGNRSYFHKENSVSHDNIITPSETDYKLLSNDQLLIELNMREIEVDSLYSVIDTLYATIDSLYYELEFLNNSLDDAKKQIPANPEFVIPDTITFAGRLVDLRNERIHEKFQTIFNREIKFAYKAIPRSGKYFAIFDSVFTAYNIPLDAKYLAVAESHLSNLASSPVGAGGIWQIMPKTGKEYHLKIDSFVDERRDVYKATDFAARFLQSNYDYLQQKGADDWLLAMAAYNAGPGSIARVMREQGSNNFFELILRVEETNDYLWRAIALKMIFEYEEQLFEKPFIQEQPLSETCRVEHLELKGHYKLDEWAQAQGTTIAMLWELNPWINITKQKRKKYTAINDVVLPPGEYNILVPIEAVKDDELLAKIEKKFESKNAGYYTFHIVKRGDTLYDIARKYNTSVASLKSLNGMRTNNIRIGQKIKLYSGSYGDSGGDGYHTVRRGETLSHIADKYNIPVARLKQLNSLKDNVIYPGQKIVLGSSSASSSGTTSTQIEKGTEFHVVQKGETLSHIADKYIIPVRTLQAINNLKGNTIFPGQKIYLGTINTTLKYDQDTPKTDSESGPNYHVIKNGETLSHVADKYLIPVAELRRINNLKSNTIYPGQKIYLSENKSSDERSHVVKSGESINSIAKKYGVSEETIITRNNLNKTNGVVIIQPGQKLVF
jgi:membrane-bound lytic murein transglycosylase D